MSELKTKQVFNEPLKTSLMSKIRATLARI